MSGPAGVHAGDHLFGVESQLVAARQFDFGVRRFPVGYCQPEQPVESQGTR
jgi:hypothetical protein